MECFVSLPQGYIGINRPANQITFIYEPTVSLQRIPKTFSIDILTAKIFRRESEGGGTGRSFMLLKRLFSLGILLFYSTNSDLFFFRDEFYFIVLRLFVQYTYKEKVKLSL